MKKSLLSACLLCIALMVKAQGGNTGMGGDDDGYQSLAERLAKVEKKHDMLSIYIDYAASAQASDAEGSWQTRFANRELRLELKGNLTDKLFYRLRHRLNKRNDAQGSDNFSKATDIAMVGYHFNDKVTLMAGKICQIWGGYEYDANPMFVYQYSDMVDHMEIFQAGATLSLKPLPTQEIALMVSDANNGTLEETYGENPVLVDGQGNYRALEKANHPLTFIANWNGSFCDDKLQTRWAWGIQKEAQGMYSRMFTLGQRLNLPKVQWYVDYMAEFDDMDRLGIVTDDVAGSLAPMNPRCAKVHYHTWISKFDWQFLPQWNLMLKGTYETASMKHSEQFSNYRKSYGWIGALEYYPDKTQNLRVFLTYIGKHIDFSKSSLLGQVNTNRIELGFMYRIKCY
ncbi:porin [Prevotella sp. P6B1]|uniref:porin n=1 Tax=Prevotella sp. P6B1 TaxID=1410613 RepID=UPI00051AAF3F|nr:porin [Prevotella sp. P6B1]